jgi:hypothetical protein
MQLGTYVMSLDRRAFAFCFGALLLMQLSLRVFFGVAEQLHLLRLTHHQWVVFEIRTHECAIGFGMQFLLLGLAETGLLKVVSTDDTDLEDEGHEALNLMLSFGLLLALVAAL